MNDRVPALRALSTPAKAALPQLDALLSVSGSAFMALHNPHGDRRDAATLQAGVAQAEKVLVSAEAISGQLREAVEPESVEAIERQLVAFVEARPNASRGDLAGYGAQLALDVMDRQPSRYALRAGLRHLRQTSRFLPSIAEVLGAVDEAERRLTNTMFHLEQLPAALGRACAELAAVCGKTGR